ncbi:unknown [Prevotella sp. CAG:1031]|nr:unknown [Prevotella sp. CAG:1031]
MLTNIIFSNRFQKTFSNFAAKVKIPYFKTYRFYIIVFSG